MTNLSVVVITRNRLDKLMRCLDSVKKTLNGCQIIVVDNGSNDGTGDYLKARRNIESVILPTNLGVAGARNIGIKKASKDYLMFLDDDAWIDRLDLVAIESYFQNNPNVCIIAPRILNPNGTIQESMRSFPTFAALFWRGTKLYKLFPNVSWYRKYIVQDLSTIKEVDWAIGACQIIRRRLFDKLGPLDEKYFFGYEDTDFCYRAKQVGYSTVFWPDSIVYHDYARISSKGLNKQLFRHCISIGRFFLKN